MSAPSSGQVRYEIEWPGLSAEEKAEGCILPCVATPETDLRIEAPRALEVSANAAHDPGAVYPAD